MRNPIQIWKEKGKILEGIKNRIFKSEHVEAIAADRLEICKRCTYIDHSGKNCIMPGSQPCCSACGCSLELKTRSLASRCPNGYWEAILTIAEEDELNKELDA